MRAALPEGPEVTVKCRIGVDEQDPQAVLPAFLETVAEAGCTRFSIHARKAWLQGLSPKENRDIPPLDYDLVRAMRARFPTLHLSVNGGITSLEAAEAFLAEGLDGVMIGRAAYHQPWDLLGRADSRIFGSPDPAPDPQAVVQAMLPYIAAHLEAGGRLHQITRHMMGLFAGRPGARRWRQILSEGASRPEAGTELVEEALASLPRAEAA
jgi:tRNA-dihydrouridine synthase A